MTIDNDTVYHVEFNEHQRKLIHAMIQLAYPTAHASLGAIDSEEVAMLIGMLDDLPKTETQVPGITHCLYL